MSLAGVRSNRGDTYQRSVALYWTVQMLLDENITGLQVDAISLPNEDYLIYGDDIVILYADGSKHFLQAKVNQASHHYWRLTDAVLKKELISAKNQLLADPSCEFHFYSRTPFGVLQRTIEEAKLHPDYQRFLTVAPQNQKDTVGTLAKLWKNDELAAFAFIKQIHIGAHHASEEWERHSLSLLRAHFSQPKTALVHIYNYVDRQHSKLGDPQYIIDRKTIFDMLEKHGIYHTLGFNEQVLIDKFRTFSLQGRQWIRTVGGAIIARPELELLKQAVHKGTSTVLLEDVAGGGKTCILLDLMDYLDNQNGITSLFIKGDLFSSINSLDDLVKFGLPQDFLAQSAHLAERRHLVIIIDSLDVLAVGRSHRSLQCFLGLISHLSIVPNITIIAASRSFDAKYDPLLREASWSETIHINPLSFKNDIAPLLIEWGVSPNDPGDTLKGLLLIPQNMRLFYDLNQKGMKLSDIEEHDLYDLYIQECIEKDPYLGPNIIVSLQNIANGLLKQRSYKFSKNELKANYQQLQRLLSQEILVEVNPHQLMFTHQTLADALRIRQAQMNNVDLHQFVTSQPQLPFIRPAVRSFVLALRSTQPDQFTRQLRHFLLDDNISMHLKRLAIESLAEMPARKGDLPIISVLSSNSPILFSRFLGRANTVDWFLLLHDHWLATANMTQEKNSATVILQYFSQFLDGHEEFIIDIWNRSLDEQWFPISNLIWLVSSDLQKLKKWNTPGASKLLRKLFDANEGERDFIGRSICKYIDATGDGDQLLWEFIIRDAKPIADIRRGRELKLNCQKHDLLNDDYLEQRLKFSDVLFKCAMDYLLQISKDFTPEDDHYPFESNLLDSTSYNRRHTNCDTLPHDSIHEFLDAVESAMKFRATNNDSCWKHYEPLLRVNRELALRYLLCETYLFNIPDNIEGISGQLTDKKLLRFSHLEYELGILTSKAYPHLSCDIQEEHQQLLMKLYDDLDNDYDWVEQKIYEHLIWIPTIYRLPELSSFFEKSRKEHGIALPSPSIGLSGGWVKSPVSTEKLIKLNHTMLIKLLQHYNVYNGWSDRDSSNGLTGGRESLERAINTASSLVPMHFVPLISSIDNAGLSTSYIYSIIDGLASHLNYRFGNTTNSNWEAIDPLPEGKVLASTVLDLIDRYCFDNNHGYTTSRALEACSLVLDDEASLKRMCFQLWRLSLHSDPETHNKKNTLGLIGEGINSVRGIAAQTLLKICNDRLDLDKPITNELEQLLIRYAKDSSMAVRATFLRRFPHFHSKAPKQGWKLIKLLFDNSKPELIKYFEQTFYYQYHSRFNEVKPYLDLLMQIDDEESASVWGRLATLAYLSGHISEEELWTSANKTHKAAKEGIGQVYIANLKSTKNSQVCIEGLFRLMKTSPAKTVFMELEHYLSHENQLRLIPLPLIKTFIENTPIKHVNDIDGVFRWFEKHTLTIPNEVLELLEQLINRLSDLDGTIYFHRADPLLTTLKLLLQEADLSDDNEFIDRVLTVQDWFLDHSVNELEALIDAA